MMAIGMVAMDIYWEWKTCLLVTRFNHWSCGKG